MAINRVDYPANLTDQDDFSAHGDLIETRFMDQVNAPQWVVSGDIPQGVVLQIGGVVYRADSDTAITGTASDYVQVTPAGATASAAYVANLSGVSWSAQYNGYYDASENLYLFDEGKALAAGEISAVFGRYLMQQPNGDVNVGRNLDVEGKIDAPTINTGQGDNEVYAMDQNVRTTDSVTFASVNTGAGANELYAMNQNVRTTDSPTFDGLTLSGEFLPTTSGSAGSISTDPFVVPRGIFNIVITAGSYRVQLFVSGAWRSHVSDFAGGTIVSDGTTVRLDATGAGASSGFYVQL